MERLQSYSSSEDMKTTQTKICFHEITILKSCWYVVAYCSEGKHYICVKTIKFCKECGKGLDMELEYFSIVRDEIKVNYKLLRNETKKEQ